MTLYEDLTRRADSIAARSAFGFQSLGGRGVAFVHGNFAATTHGFRRAVVGKALRPIADGFTLPCLYGLEPDAGGYYADDDVLPRLAEAAKGIAAGFREAFPAEKHAPYRFAAALVLAAPLMIFFGDHSPDATLETLPGAGFGLNLYSQASGRGKSALQLLCAYTMAHPTALTVSGALGVQGGTSVTAVTSMLKTLNSYPLMCDEITNSDPEALSALYYSLSMGQEKRRASQTGGLLDSGRWATVALSSSNISVRDVLSSIRQTGAAEQLRFMEVNLDTIDDGNMGDDPTAIHGIINRHFRANRGAVPLLLANYAVRNMDAIAADALRLQALTTGTLKLSTKERFYGRALAAAMLAQRILSVHGVDMFTDKDLVTGFKKALRDSREHIESSVLTGEALFQECLRALDAHIIKTDIMGDARHGKLASVHNPHAVRRPLAGRYITESGELLLSVTAVRKWCTDNRVSFAQWKKAAAAFASPEIHLVGSQNKCNITKGISGEAVAQVRCMAYRIRDTSENAQTTPATVHPLHELVAAGGDHA